MGRIHARDHTQYKSSFLTTAQGFDRLRDYVTGDVEGAEEVTKLLLTYHASAAFLLSMLLGQFLHVRQRDSSSFRRSSSCWAT